MSETGKLQKAALREKFRDYRAGWLSFPISTREMHTIVPRMRAGLRPPNSQPE